MIPFTDFGGNKPKLQFLHANGYPPACYLPLISLLQDRYHVSAMHLRPLWPGSNPQEIESWHPLSTDFLQFLDENESLSPPIAIGHSIGAIVSLRAALWHPERFRALVLIDPVLFPPHYIVFAKIAKTFGLGYKLHPLITRTLKRRRNFDNLEKLFASYRRKDIFRYFSDLSLRAYINGITKPSNSGGFELVYSPEWEARIYYSGVWRDNDIWQKLRSLKIPILIIRGAETDTFLLPTSQRVKRIRPETNIITIEKSTHLVPLEKPQETYQAIQDFLKENV